MTLRGEDPVGFGVLVKSTLYEDVASIGMYTIERLPSGRGRHGDDCDVDRGVPSAFTAPGGGVLVLQPPLATDAAAGGYVLGDSPSEDRILTAGFERHLAGTTSPRCDSERVAGATHLCAGSDHVPDSQLALGQHIGCRMTKAAICATIPCHVP